MRSTKFFVLALLTGQGALASALTVTGFSYTVNSYGVQVVTNSVDAEHASAGEYLSIGWSGVLGGRFPRTGSGGAVYADLWLSFRVEDIPVEIYNLNTASSGKLVNGGGNATNPRTVSQTYGIVYEVGDTNGDQVYTLGENLYQVPIYAHQTNANLTGNGYQVYNTSGRREERYVLGARSVYVARLHHYMGGSAEALSYEPTITVTDEVFYEGFAFMYQAVPEPASLAALGLAVAALARRRRR